MAMRRGRTSVERMWGSCTVTHVSQQSCSLASYPGALGTSYASKISRYTYLEIYDSRAVFAHMLQKSGEKKPRDLNLEFFGGYFTIYFCEVKLEFFLQIFLSLVFLFVIRSQKSQDFPSTEILFHSFSFALLRPMVKQYKYYHLFYKDGGCHREGQ